MSEFLFTKNVVLSNAADFHEARLYPGPRLSQQLSAREKQNPDHADTLITSVNSLTRSSSSLFSVWNLSLSLAPESVALFCPHVRRIKHFVCFLRTRLKACVYRWCRLKTNKQTNKKHKQKSTFLWSSRQTSVLFPGNSARSAARTLLLWDKVKVSSNGQLRDLAHVSSQFEN